MCFLLYSCTCWQDSVPCGLSDWCLRSSWAVNWRPPLFLCHVGLSLEYLTAWKLVSSSGERASKSTSKKKNKFQHDRRHTLLWRNHTSDITFAIFYSLGQCRLGTVGIKEVKLEPNSAVILGRIHRLILWESQPLITCHFSDQLAFTRQTAATGTKKECHCS